MKLMKYARNELVGKKHSILLTDQESSSEKYKNFWLKLKAGQFQSGDFLRMNKFGKEVWVRGCYSPIFDIHGNPYKVLKYAFEITKSRETNPPHEAEKVQSAANLAILNQKKGLDSAAIVAETDNKGRITYVNTKFMEISKYLRDELMGQDHRILNSHYHPKEFFVDLWKTISGGHVWHGEIKNRAKDGSYYWVDTTIYPVRDANNEPQGYVSIRFDITSQKEALESSEAAKAKAILANQAKSNFLYTVSHEIRSPLNGVIGMTSLLEETELSEDQRGFCEMISLSGKTMLTLINGVLDFSKIEAGKLELEETEFDFGKYLRDLTRPFQYSAKQKNITFKLDCPDYDFYVLGDSGRFGQIVTNLVSNAIKFTKAGGVTVRVELTSQDEHTAIMLVVQDSGVGIPDVGKSLLFKPFSQAEKSTNSQFGGTGLGLSISKKLVEMMGGKISFESIYGQGTTFKVELLFKKGQRIEKSSSIQRNQERPAVARKYSLSPIQKKNNPPLPGHVLVAEDNLTNQKVISRILDRLNCKHQLVVNGREVLDAMKKGSYDLILMDCQMPELDGYAASRLIRKSEELYRAIPIVALTANAVEGDEEKCREAGMNDYLSKPIDKIALEAVLKKHLLKLPPVDAPALALAPTPTLALAPTPSPLAELPQLSVMIDKTVLKQFEDLQLEGRPDFLLEVIDSFLRTSPLCYAAIFKFFENRDIVNISKQAHALKSSAQLVGALLLGEVCQKLEDFMDEKNLAGLESLLESLKTRYPQSCSELRDISINRKKNLVRESA